MEQPHRKIAALLAADVVGYTLLMQADESRTLEALKIRREIFARLVREHEGHVFGSVGDSLMAEFPSAVNAALCSVAIQRAVLAENEPLPADQRMLLRIGLNLGDVIDEHETLYGDSVIMAARLQALAAPGGICLSGSVYEQVKHYNSIEFEYTGLHTVKNVAEPVTTYQVMQPGVVKGSQSLWSELWRRNVLKVGVAYSILAWLLMELVVPVLPGEDAGRWIVHALTGLAIVGFPLVLCIAWRYEVTPSGLKRSEDVLRQDSITRLTGRRLDGILTGLLVAAAVFVVLDNDLVGRPSSELGFGGTTPSTPVLPKSIAVLPFDNSSIGDEDAAFFADGVHEDLVTLLSKLSDIRVISRTSVERYRNTDQSIHEIAAMLGVSSVLEGGVRLAGDNVRINVQLIDAATETDLWAEIYDRELTATNVFGIQSEVTAKIVDSLQVTLTSGERRRLAAVPTENLEAYEAYLLAKQQMRQRTVASLQAAVEFFRRAVELDPNFALAYVGLAESYFLLQDWGHLPRDSVISIIREAATKAIALDSQLGEAYVSLAGLYEWDRDYPAAVAAYERALELSPGYSIGHSWYSLFLLWPLGRWEESLEQAEQAVALDPLSPLLRVVYGFALSAVGRFDEALTQYRRGTELDPEFSYAYKGIGDFYVTVSGNLDEAHEWYQSAVAATQYSAWISDVGGIYLMLGDLATAESWIEQARLVEPDNFYVNRQLAILNTYRGEDALAESFARNTLEGPFNLDMEYMLFVLHNADLRKGRYADARLRYEEFHPALAAEDPSVNRSNYRAAINLSVVLEKMGERPRAQRLRQKSLSVIRRMPRLGVSGYGVADAEIYALQGNTSAALAALRAAVDEGWRTHWYFWTERNPNLAAIADEAEYQTVIADLESDMAVQLQQIRDRGSYGGP